MTEDDKFFTAEMIEKSWQIMFENLRIVRERFPKMLPVAIVATSTDGIIMVPAINTRDGNQFAAEFIRKMAEGNPPVELNLKPTDN